MARANTDTGFDGPACMVFALYPDYSPDLIIQQLAHNNGSLLASNGCIEYIKRVSTIRTGEYHAGQHRRVTSRIPRLKPFMLFATTHLMLW